MKKLIFAIVALVGVVAVLPFVGNTVVQKTIEQRLELFESYGLDSKLLRKESGYLETKLHYRMKITDKKKFLEYLEQFSSKQIPPYVESLLDGVTFGVDIAYNNIPLSKKVVVEFYPTALSQESMQTISKESPKLADFITRILQKRALFYHVEYDVVSITFKGYVKDFDESAQLENNVSLHLFYNGVEANGEGLIVAPAKMDLKIGTIALAVESSENKLEVALNGLKEDYAFENETNFFNRIEIDSLVSGFADKQAKRRIDLKVKKTFIDVNVQERKKRLDIASKSGFEQLLIDGGGERYTFDSFAYEGALQEVDAESFVTIEKIFKKASTMGRSLTQQEAQAVQNALVKLLAKGLRIDIRRLVLKRLSVPKAKNIEGFAIDAHLRIKPDSALVSNQNDPKRLAKNISFRSHIDLSLPFYAFLNNFYPIDIMAAQFKKLDNDHVLFDIDYENGKVKINDKVLR